ncbi:hypothetical protein NQ318_010225 [Aromia moschata]|uniref:Uncharacterized protein n=1 Tax=Aromia moschata TaxID=1265417 RepID=A0AAV8X8P9_9CUCU|nr:hypothetical protein NQ318_010225 [Aromia moschata]
MRLLYGGLNAFRLFKTKLDPAWLLRLISDAARTLCDVHHLESESRKILLGFCLNKSFKEAFVKAPVKANLVDLNLKLCAPFNLTIRMREFKPERKAQEEAAGPILSIIFGPDEPDSQFKGEKLQTIQAIQTSPLGGNKVDFGHRYSQRRQNQAIYNPEKLTHKNLFDNVTKHLRSLKALGEPTEHWDTLIIHIITSKLDNTTRREWESFELKQELPLMEDINKFLKQRCELLEKLESSIAEQMLLSTAVVRVRDARGKFAEMSRTIRQWLTE